MIDLKTPGLILRVYEALDVANRSATTHVQRDGNYLVSCPHEAHLDKHPSCTLDPVNNRWYCYTGAFHEARGGYIPSMIIASGATKRYPRLSDKAAALRWLDDTFAEGIVERAGLNPQAAPRSRDLGKQLRDETLVATYPYVTAGGVLLYQVRRYKGYNDDGELDKTFKTRRTDGAGRWIYHLAPSCRKPACACHGDGPLANVEPPLLPYCLDEVSRAIERGRVIIFCEGEQDADTLRALGFVATTVPFGAGEELTLGFIEHFRGASLVIFLPDADATGRAAAALRARAVAKHAEVRIAIADLAPEANDGRDVTDLHRASRFTHRSLARAVENSLIYVD